MFEVEWNTLFGDLSDLLVLIKDGVEASGIPLRPTQTSSRSEFFSSFPLNLLSSSTALIKVSEEFQKQEFL